MHEVEWSPFLTIWETTKASLTWVSLQTLKLFTMILKKGIPHTAASCATTRYQVSSGRYLQSKIVHEEFLGSDLDRAFFAVAVIPEASSIMDPKMGKKWDSVRALLVFDKNKFMYMLHSEINTVLDPVHAASLTDKDLEAARKAMQRMRASIRFQ